MTFGAPALLLGLLAVAAPVIVHLIHQRRAPRVAFSAIALLRESKERRAPYMRIKQLALLAARMLFFLAIPLAMARPSCDGDGSDTSTTGRLPASVVLIIDDSASMSAPIGRGDIYARAVAAAERAIAELRPWDKVGVVIASAPPVVLTPSLSDDHSAVRRALRTYEPVYGASDLSEALRAAVELHASSAQPVAQTFVLSDDTQTAWGPVLATSLPAPLGAITRAPLANEPPRGVAVVALDSQRAATGEADAYQIDASIVAWGEPPNALDVSLLIDGETVGAQRIDAFQDGRAVVRFTHSFERDGPYYVEVVIRGDTGAPADDRRAVMLQTQRAVRVIAVDGDPRAVAINSETYFLTQALSVGSRGNPVAETTTTNAERLGDYDLGEFDVVVLANVAALSPAQVERLERFVDAGGGLLLAMGDAVDPARWNSSMAGLLPKPLRTVRALSTPGTADAGLHATRIAELSANHAVGRPFLESGGASLRAALVHRYVLLEPQLDDGSLIVGTFADGAPALVERARGQGAVMLWTSTLDADWNDLPLSTAFVPLVHRLVEVLGRRAGAEASAEVGRAHRIDVEAYRADQIIIESGVEGAGTRAVLTPESGTIRFVPSSFGAHRVSVHAGGETARAPRLDFAVNAPAEEASPDLVDVDALDALLETSAQNSAEAGSDVEGSGRPVWPSLLLLGLFALYAESILAVRARVWTNLAAILKRWRRA